MNKSTVHRIDNADQAELLLAGAAASVMAAYVTPRTQSEAAAMLEVSLAVVHRWTTRLADVGLLQVVEEIPRKGRPMKRYRAIASVVDIPAELMPMSYRERQAKLQAERQYESRLRQRWFLEGNMRISMAETVDGSPQFAVWFPDSLQAPGYGTVWHFSADPVTVAAVKEVLERAMVEVHDLMRQPSTGKRWMLHVDLSPNPRG